MIPKRLVHYVVNAVVLRLSDLESENKRLKEQLEKCKCLNCDQLVFDDGIASICCVCDRFLCNGCCNGENEYWVCDNHPNLCGCCLENTDDFADCMICSENICEECANEGNYDELECKCGKTIKSCRKHNSQHFDFLFHHEWCNERDCCVHHQNGLFNICPARIY